MQTTNEVIEVSNLRDHNLIELPMVYSRPRLPISTNAIGTQEDVNRWPHLKGITVPNIEAEIGLLKPFERNITISWMTCYTGTGKKFGFHWSNNFHQTCMGISL